MCGMSAMPEVRIASTSVAIAAARRAVRVSAAMIASFYACRFATVVLNGQSSGLYDHYFRTFLQPVDILWSFAQAIAMGLAVMLIHTYYGYTASGGPVGVGAAVGHSVRTSLIVLTMLLLAIALSIYGQSGNFHLSG